MMVYKQFIDADYTRLRKSLLKTKGGDVQKEFLRKTNNQSEFLSIFRDVGTQGNASPSLLTIPLSEPEFKHPPPDTEQTIYENWRTLPAGTACRSTFWAFLTTEHLKQNIIEPVFLAANGIYGGAERIDRALSDTTSKASKQVDDCVRTVLRRLGGLPEARGNRSVYVDCPFARAWWRERMVQQAADQDKLLTRRVRNALRQSQTHWEKLIDRIVFRNSTFGARNIRNAFILAWSKLVQDVSDEKHITANDLKRLCRRASAIQGTRELSVLPSEALVELMGELVATTTQTFRSE